MKLISLMPMFFFLIIVIDYCHSFLFAALPAIMSAFSSLTKLGKRSAKSQPFVDVKRRGLDKQLDDLISKLSEY
uniref:Antimicrobial peptide n=1 Tax=Hadrurus spadix TaxID=141984 RepID=A0A1W7RB13_9SCOR